MAAIKLVIFLCCAVFYINAQPYELKGQFSYIEVQDAESDALALLEQLEEVISMWVNYAQVVINGFVELLNNGKEAVIQDAQENLEEAVEPLVNAIKLLKHEAAVADVNITDCVGNSIEELTQLPVKFLDIINSCIDSKVTEVEEYINQQSIKINSTYDMLSDLGNQINACGNESLSQQEACFTEVGDKISDIISNLPLEIYNDIGYIRVNVYSAIPQMAMCSAGTFDDIEEEGEAIVDIVTECAVAKINGTTVEFLNISV